MKSYYLVADPLHIIPAVSLWHIDITRLLVSSFEILVLAFNAANSHCCLFWGVSAFTLLFSWWKSCSIGFKSGDWLGQYKTFYFFALINSLTELAGCFGSLSWCNMKHFPMNLVAFSWILVGKMVLYRFWQYILLLSSYIKSSVKLRQPCMPMPWHHLHHALQMRLYMLRIFCSSLFSPHFCFPIT